MIKLVFQGLLDLLYPDKCAVCGELDKEIICDSCMKKISFIANPVCCCCGLPGIGGLCKDCSAGGLAFEKARSVGFYEDVLAKAVKIYKYRPAPHLAIPLSKLMTDFLQTPSGMEISNVDCVMPVPIHSTRQRERGFNQSKLLADAVGTALEVPVTDIMLVRAKRTRPQVGLKPRDRRINVDDAFDVVDKEKIMGLRILLIDDVMTTGSTLSACADTLKKQGAGTVYALTLAREVSARQGTL